MNTGPVNFLGVWILGVIASAGALQSRISLKCDENIFAKSETHKGVCRESGEMPKKPVGSREKRSKKRRESGERKKKVSGVGSLGFRESGEKGPKMSGVGRNAQKSVRSRELGDPPLWVSKVPYLSKSKMFGVYIFIENGRQIRKCS